MDCCNDIKYREPVLVTFLVLYSPHLATVVDADDFLCYFFLFHRYLLLIWVKHLVKTNNVSVYFLR